jgi:peptide/nickel transport system ATP-binding protein
MYLGKLVEIGTPKEILNNPQHPYTKALLWASPDLVGDKKRTEMPMRDIDIPDPVDPPTGCRFHTRCPKAREVCTDVEPNLRRRDGDGQQTACFRTVDEHEYWDRPSIVTE